MNKILIQLALQHIFLEMQLFVAICIGGWHCVKYVVSPHVVVPVIALAGELDAELNLHFFTQLSTLQLK